MALSVGTPAPDFELTTLGADGPALVKLSEHVGKGPILLLFVPMAFTGGCTAEFCEVSSQINEYNDLGATVLGISGDNPFAQAAWAEKEGITLTLLSDYEHAVTAAYDVSYDSFLPAKNLTMGGVSKRSAFIVDNAGNIAYAESADDPSQMPDFGAIKAKLAELK